MKRGWLTLLFVIATLHGVVAQHPHRTVSMAFYNAENLYDTINDPGVDDEDFTPRGKYHWNTERYKTKIANIARVLRSIDTVGVDLVGLCELENSRVIDDLLCAMGDRGAAYDYVHFNSSDSRGIDVALLFRKSRFAIEGTENISGGGFRQPLLVWGRVGSERLYVFVTHMPSKSSSSVQRNRAAQRLRTAIDSVATADRCAKIVVMGDLNDSPEGYIQRDVLKFASKINPFQLRDSPSRYFYNPFSRFSKQGRGSLVYRDRWQMFDCIVVNGNLLQSKGLCYDPYYPTIDVVSLPWMMETEGTHRGYPCRTILFGKVQSGYSDHLPVILKLNSH